MAKLKYVMNETEQKLYNMIEQDGISASITALVCALKEYGHTMSDMGIKDKANQAHEVADMLRDIRDVIEE
jgi:hypothetical protein